MPVEIEHTFIVFKPRIGSEETSEVLKIDAGPFQALKIMDGLQLNVKSNEEVRAGELFVGNQQFPEDPEKIISITKYPHPTASSGIKVDVRNPIKFSGAEVVEVTSPMYTDRLRFQYTTRPSSSYGNIPRQTA